MDPFEPSLATSRPLRVSVDRIVDPLASVPHNLQKIEAYRADMIGGARFPPIGVVRFGRHFLVADGHKRFAAFVTSGQPEVWVDVWTWTDWIRDQTRQARDHMGKQGRVLRLSLTDPRAAFRLWASTFTHWWRVARMLARRGP